MSTHAQATSVLDSNKVRALFERHLQLALFNYNETAVHIDDLRAHYKAKHGVCHPDKACADFEARIAEEENKVRVRAFDSFVAGLAKMIRSEDPNMVLPVIRRAGIKFKEGTVWVYDDGVWKRPELFKHESYLLFPDL